MTHRVTTLPISTPPPTNGQVKQRTSAFLTRARSWAGAWSASSFDSRPTPRLSESSRLAGLPFEDGDDLFELQTFGLRQVPGTERDRQHREAGECHHHPRQPAPLVQGWESLDDHEVGQPVDTRADRGSTAAYAGGEILALDQLARNADTDL